MTILSVLAVLIAGGHQAATQDVPRLFRYPAVRGDTIVFTYAGNLWSVKTSGGLARRLTSDPGPDARAKISPDGSTIAFTGTYDGSADIYTIPIEGGEPKRVTYSGDAAICSGWTPDNKIAYVSTAGSYTNRQSRLWLVAPTGGMPISTKLEECTDISFFDTGHRAAYERQTSFLFNWRHYRGGSQGKISLYDFDKNTYNELPVKHEQDYYPMVVGNSVYHVSDRSENTLNLYRYDMDSKKDVELTHYTDSDIHFPSTDGKSIVWERDGILYEYDIATGAAKEIAAKIAGDLPTIRPALHRLGTSVSSLSLSPSGARLAVEARGFIFSVPAHDGETRMLYGKPGTRGKMPAWSPDGTTIAYLSDESGEFEIYTQPQMGGAETQLTTVAGATIDGFGWTPDGKKMIFSTSNQDLYVLDVATKKVTLVEEFAHGVGGVDISPDSKWIAYSPVGTNQIGAVYLYEIETGKKTRVTSGFYYDTDVAFDRNGKYLYFVSERTFNPGDGLFEFSLKIDDAARIYAIPLSKDAKSPLEPPVDEERTGPQGPPSGGPSKGMKIDLDDMESRAVVLPLPAGGYHSLTGVENGVIFGSGPALMKFDLNSRQAMPLGVGFLGPASFNESRTKLAYSVGGTVGIVDLHPGMAPGEGKVNTSNVEATIDPRQEWKQIYWEAFRWQRDHFYDPNFLGLDINALGKHYAQYLPYLGARSDLTYVLGMFIGEFGTSHSYVGGGDPGRTNPPVPVGLLGADYSVDGGQVRFAKVYQGMNYDEAARGPLGEPGMNVHSGDYLLAIDGHPVNANTAPGALLLDKIGKTVRLTVNTTNTMTGARQIDVRPIGSESNLRYLTWVQENRAKVDKLSGGRIGYIHVPDTSEAGAIGLIKGFYAQVDKEAVIVDERFNGGGHIQPWFVDTLGRRIRVGIENRHGADNYDEAAIEGPKAMLINGYAGSGGDLFPYMFREAKLGPLIGMRTWGGLVGIGVPAPLVDGGILYTPEFSLFNRDSNEIVAENRGISPDIEVDQRPDLIADGQDPQLEAAVNYLLDQLKTHPPRPPRTKLPTRRIGDWTGSHHN